MQNNLTLCGNYEDCAYRYGCRRNPENHFFKEEQLEGMTTTIFEHSNLKCEYFIGE